MNGSFFNLVICSLKQLLAWEVRFREIFNAPYSGETIQQIAIKLGKCETGTNSFMKMASIMGLWLRTPLEGHNLECFCFYASRFWTVDLEIVLTVSSWSRLNLETFLISFDKGSLVFGHLSLRHWVAPPQNVACENMAKFWVLPPTSKGRHDESIQVKFGRDEYTHHGFTPACHIWPWLAGRYKIPKIGNLRLCPSCRFSSHSAMLTIYSYYYASSQYCVRWCGLLLSRGSMLK